MTEMDTTKKRVGDLIVVGSLVSKMPNLANLTRSSEIFGVKELTIPSKKILTDQNFTSVTVTAEKWLPLVDVAPENIGLYIRMKKKEGYSVLPLI